MYEKSVGREKTDGEREREVVSSDGGGKRASPACKLIDAAATVNHFTDN